MEDWERDLIRRYSSTKNTGMNIVNVRSLVNGLLKKERERDKLQELLDFVKKSKTDTDILFQYVKNNVGCNATIASGELNTELGISPISKESTILCILERYFKEHPKL